MARRVVLTSDLSGEPGARTVEFSFDGVNFELDLTEDEVQQFRIDLAQYFDVARARSGGGSRIPTPSRVGYSAAEVRDWAHEQGIELPSKGRLPNVVVARFLEAHGQRT